MTNEENNEPIIDSTETNEEVEEPTEAEAKDEPSEEKKEPKAQETPEAKRARLKRQLAQLDKKHGFKDEITEAKTESKKEQKSDDFDYGQKAFLRSYDIKGADEIALVKNWVKRTGDELDVAVEDEIFQSKLKSLREARATAEATPKGKNRGTQPAQNDESYWTAKIEQGQATLNDIPDIALRRKVLNKRIEQEKSGSKFSPQGIVIT